MSQGCTNLSGLRKRQLWLLTFYNPRNRWDAIVNQAFIKKVTKKILFHAEHSWNMELVQEVKMYWTDKYIEKAVYKLMKQVQIKKKKIS